LFKGRRVLKILKGEKVTAGDEHNIGIVVARAPNHLGDGVMAIPAMRALSMAAAELIIVAPAWGKSLYAELDAQIVARTERPVGDVAVLFPPSFRAAWETRHISRRIGWPGDWRRWLLTDSVVAVGHRIERYNALLAPLGVVVSEAPSLSMNQAVEPTIPQGTVGLNPISVSGETVEWAGFRALADALDAPVTFFAGPGEETLLSDIAGEHPQLSGLSLEAFAAELSRCAVFVSNDSGAAHFARSLGVPTIVIFGSTDPEMTGPMGSVAIEGDDMACRPCYKKTCRVGGVPCLEIPVARVLEAVNTMLQTTPCQ
jgi:heptosyltransferase-2